MDPKAVNGTVLVTTEEVQRFAQATGDASPLHTDESYARRTPFGEPVAHGVLCLLKVLAAGPVWTGLRLREVRVRFAGPVMPEQRCHWTLEKEPPEGENGTVAATYRLTDGPRVLLEAELGLVPGELRSAPRRPARPRAVRTPATEPLERLVTGTELGVHYRPDWDALGGLLDALGLHDHGVDVEHLAALGWASSLAGMEAPGRAALVNALEVTCTQAPRQRGFTARGEIAHVDERFRTVQLTGEVTAGRLLAQVALRVFARRERSAPSADLVRRSLGAHVSSRPLAGETAFVAGGSRGLGAALVQALAIAGCTVHVGYRHSRDDADALVAALGQDADRVYPHQGDVGDPEWCAEVSERISGAGEQIGLLVLNAGPPAQGLDLHTSTVARSSNHVRRAVELAQAPLAAFATDLDQSGGRIVAVSSAYVTEHRRGLAHYAAAKHAVEGLTRAVTAEFPSVGALIARPPRLATTFADSVIGTDEALPVEPVAAEIVQRLLDGSPRDSVRVVEHFSQSALNAVPEPREAREVLSAPATTGEVKAQTAGSRGALALVGTFTTDPIREVLEHWVDRLELDVEVRLAPYGQVFQELLDPFSTFASNTRGCNVVLIRLEDWPGEEEALRTVEEFAAAAEVAARRDPVPLAVVMCPASPTLPSERAAEIAMLEERLAAHIAEVSGVHFRSSATWSGAYSVDQFHDAPREKHGHIPYTHDAFTVLGTSVARTAHSLLIPPFKVLVLDCDNSLWGGVVGEDGATGVRLGAGHRRLQDWAVEQHDRGVLVCLCSKNAETDVDDVFRVRREMPLRPEHIAARRVNWDSKPTNLVGLAEELGLGLDSFVFLDDNPVEVAAVSAACPQVFALTLPNEEELPGFLDRLWAFDRTEVTEEDRQRTSMYRAGRSREALRCSTTTLADFIAGLELRITVREAQPDQLARVAQLTQRTNQFNLSTIRRSVSELRAFLAEGARCWVAEVSDRFGEYGLVGAALTQDRGDTVVLDTFLMSCRVLGRGVEHAFLADIAGEVGSACSSTLEASYRPTAKNTPAGDFFATVLGAVAEHTSVGAGDSVVYRAPLEAVTGVSFRPDEVAPTDVHAAGDENGVARDGVTNTSDRGSEVSSGTRLAALAELTTDLIDTEQLHQHVAAEPVAPLRAEAAPAGPSAAIHAPGCSGEEALNGVCDVLARLRRMPRGELNAETTLESLRLESLEIVDATVALEQQFGRLPASLFFEHHTLGSLATAVAEGSERVQVRVGADEATLAAGPQETVSLTGPERRPTGDRNPEAEVLGTGHRARRELPQDTEGIAVVGLAGRYPGAADISEFWRNLLAGTESLSDVATRWGASGAEGTGGNSDGPCTWAGGMVDGVDAFDSLFFNLAPSEAETMDPQQRLFLQTAYHALEDAGHTTQSLGRNVGVYVASMGPDYAVLSANAALDGRSRYPNSDLYQLANRVSYFLDLTGPSLAVDTACSGSGVALQLACDAIRSGSVTAAIAGGVNLILHPARRSQYGQLGMLSATGRCQPFGAGADGMVTSEGIGAVLLRPLRDAVSDGDHIYGVIKAIRTNSGGRTSGFNVPSPAAQAELVSATLTEADVDPASVGYVEAHGTGTPLGDPIEIRGLTEAYGDNVAGPIGIGSVKGNIGHTEAAAALAGLTKVLLQMRHGQLVPSLHADQLNPRIDFDRTPFRVQRATRPWPARSPDQPRRSALSSFGAGGVNVHMLVEEGPELATPVPRQEDAPEGAQLILLSAADERQLRAVCTRLARWLRASGNEFRLPDVAFTLRSGRAQLATRAAFVVDTSEELLRKLDLLAEADEGVEAAADRAGASYGTLGAPGAGLSSVFDGSAEMVEVLGNLARRGSYRRLGQLWCQGARIDWHTLIPRSGERRLSLPGYPFVAARHWLPEPNSGDAHTVAPPSVGGADTSSGDIAYYEPYWSPAPRGPADLSEKPRVFVLGFDDQWGAGADRLVTDPSEVGTPDGHGRPWVVVDRRRLDAPSATADRASDELATAVALARRAVDGQRITYVCLSRADDHASRGWAVVGFGRGLAQENPLFGAARVEVAAGSPGPTLADVLTETYRGRRETRFEDGVPLARRWRRLTAADARAAAKKAPVSFRNGGHYLITGGAGGIGRLLAVHLARRFRASVTLLGRSDQPSGGERLSESVRACGGHLSYLRADVTDPTAVADALASARRENGPLRGVVHAAGVLEDGSFHTRSDAAIDRVLAPKVTGTRVLDEATASDDLDFFLLMSSYVGLFGNVGQAAYCAANRYLDGFAEQRAVRVVEGQRTGRSLALVWPLWRDGGMRMPAATEELTFATLGLTAIDPHSALRAIEDVLTLDSATVLIGCGDHERIGAALAALDPDDDERPGDAYPPVGTTIEAGSAAGSGKDGRFWLDSWLRSEAAALVKVPVGQVDSSVEFGNYGFHSTLFTDFANRINAHLRLALTPVTFFEYPTIRLLAAELYRRHQQQIDAAAGHGRSCDAEMVEPEPTPFPEPSLDGNTSVELPSAERADAASVQARPVTGTQRHADRAVPIAVVGMAGRFPGAPDVDTYWDNLLAGRTYVNHAPKGRFGTRQPHGAFLDDVLDFDAAFFGISPREARLMDPQQRMFLETGWHALEDAGCDPRSLAGSRSGVFVGATLSDYSELLARNGEEVMGHTITGHVQSVIANRLSHVLDLHGPSEVVDTACSSSLSAVHRAVRALESSECELAIAGGVNALFTSTWFESLEAAGMLSATGRCWTFDARADGFVRGEGVAAVVLKPLESALRDGDLIHGVIRGSAVNHGGRSHSLTAPNPDFQADVVASALRRAEVHPRTISYIETHGTGTELGDPIEVSGLRTAFRQFEDAMDEGWCHLGAVKTNIGHLESAAGIAGLVKVLLAVRHRCLPRNAAGDQANPHLDLAEGPFRVLRETRPWQPRDADGSPLPLRAGLSAFGFGGANAHVVIEEPPSVDYPDDRAERTDVPQVVVLSAQDDGRLKEYARRLREVVSTGSSSLTDLAYTSRVGRPALPTRLAMVVSTRAELLTMIDCYLTGRTERGMYTSNGAAPSESSDCEVQELAHRWVSGSPIDWPSEPAGRRVPFPTYPFDHSTPYGPAIVAAGESSRPPDPAASEAQLLTRHWVPTSLPYTRPQGRPCCLLLIGREAEVALLETLAELDEFEWVVLREPSPLPAMATHEYEADFEDEQAGRDFAAELVKRHGPFHAVVDLVDGAGAHGLWREAGRISLLQALTGSSGSDPLRIVHVRRQASATDGERDGNLADALTGVRMAGLVRAIGAEYSAVRAVSVEADETMVGLPELLKRAVREIPHAGDEPDVRYHGGARQVARLAAAPSAAPVQEGALGAFAVRPDRPYIFTGGTGGLGLATAELLVERGARRVVLLGRRALPPRAQWPMVGDDSWWRAPVEAIQRWEAAGVEVLFHSVQLSQQGELARFFEYVRSRLGRIAGVVHCAGSVAPTPAFVHKTRDEIEECWEPKGSGLLALDQALAADTPDFVALYSSLSAVVPSLAVGLTDYASGNAVLDAYAEYRARSAPATRWLSLGWGSWTGLGMGEVTSRRYRDLGLSALTRDDGLALLDAALSTTGPAAVTALKGTPDIAGRLLPGEVDAESGHPDVPRWETPLDVDDQDGRTLTDHGEAPGAEGSGASTDLTEWCVGYLTDLFADALLLDRNRIGPDTAFADLGVDSILIAGIVRKLESLTGSSVPPSVILEQPTVTRLARHVTSQYREGIERWAAPRASTGSSSVVRGDVSGQRLATSQPSPDPSATSTAPAPLSVSGGSGDGALPLAVVGMAGRFPGAATTAEFWSLLREGRSGVREVPRSRWDIASWYSSEPQEGRSISKWGGFLNGIDEFDPAYFGIPEADAAHIDPLTRLFLECAEYTFADAGYRGDELAGRRVGVFVGSGTSTYGSRIETPGRATATGLNQNFIAAHLAHFRDLRGPNLVVDSACSSSLTSLYLAHQALQLGECEMALVGGADLILDERPYLSLSAARALSPDGTCHVFDEEANGFVPGEGVGAVLLKPLERALTDGDRVLAVVEAAALNNDGRTMGLTTPNADAQKEVVAQALRKAGAGADTVSYVEAHGTGTMIGDPIELQALSQVFSEHTTERGFCTVGSVKSNVGHLLMAAGMASLQKVVLSLMHRQLPPTLHCARPNSRFSFETSPFRLSTDLRHWEPRHGVRRAGISAFGFGGTNAHVMVRDFHEAERGRGPAQREPLPPPVFQRGRHWAERPTPPPNATPPRSPLLELEELI